MDFYIGILNKVKFFRLFKSVLFYQDYFFIVEIFWGKNVEGNYMRKVWLKRKNLKGDLKNFNKYLVFYVVRFEIVRKELEDIQRDLRYNFFDIDLILKERVIFNDIDKWLIIEE